MRAQLKMGETIAVLIVFFIMIMIALVVYADFRATDVKDQEKENIESQTIELANKISLLPEILCSDTQCIGCSGALDILKLDVMVYGNLEERMHGIIEKNLVYYSPRLGNSYVKVSLAGDMDEAMSSNGDFDGTWVLYNHTPNNYNRVRPLFLPVNLYNAKEDLCHFGVMEVGLYET